ncbi:hypothetical protein H0H92_005872 [Tricholoma furcatifolium]|nr:hypothetical protein H0H92_005872 [Tricholoma furcatifolium]
MAQSTEQRRQNHNAACQRYRDRNLDKSRASARERMRRLRARRKENVEHISSTATTNFATLPQDVDRPYYRTRAPGGGPSTLNVQELERAVKAALECDRSDFKSESELHRAHMQLLMATLPPSSEPEYSDSDSSDIHTLPVVTDSSSAEDDGCSISDSSETSSDEEREVVLLLTALSDMEE